MSKKPIRPEWTTTVDPSEYDYVAQFTRMVKLANRHQECYTPVDVGKVWGLVQSHQRLERENAALRETLMKCRFYVTNWEAYDDDSAYKRLEMLRKMDAFIEPASKEQP